MLTMDRLSLEDRLALPLLRELMMTNGKMAMWLMLLSPLAMLRMTSNVSASKPMRTKTSAMELHDDFEPLFDSHLNDRSCSSAAVTTMMSTMPMMTALVSASGSCMHLIVVVEIANSNSILSWRKL